MRWACAKVLRVNYDFNITETVTGRARVPWSWSQTPILRTRNNAVSANSFSWGHLFVGFLENGKNIMTHS